MPIITTCTSLLIFIQSAYVILVSETDHETDIWSFNSINFKIDVLFVSKMLNNNFCLTGLDQSKSFICLNNFISIRFTKYPSTLITVYM